MHNLEAAFVLTLCLGLVFAGDPGCEAHCDDLDYRPVCGVDLRSYANPCFADCDHATIACQGECPCLQHQEVGPHGLVEK